jgi:hypothetical protein
MSGGLEWTSLLPRYVLSEPDRGSLAAIWALALIAAAWPRRGAVSGRSLAAALCGAGLVAGIAASVTTARPGGRDSVRVVGKAALLVGARPMLQRAADGCWNAALLYEPFRHPDGAVIAERLPLAHGSYRVVLNRLEVGGPPNPPELRVQPEPPSAVRRTPFVVSAETATSDFAVVAGERAVTLSIGGGSAFVLQTVCLSRSTNTGSDGLMP